MSLVVGYLRYYLRSGHVLNEKVTFGIPSWRVASCGHHDEGQEPKDLQTRLHGLHEFRPNLLGDKRLELRWVPSGDWNLLPTLGVPVPFLPPPLHLISSAADLSRTTTHLLLGRHGLVSSVPSTSRVVIGCYRIILGCLVHPITLRSKRNSRWEAWVIGDFAQYIKSPAPDTHHLAKASNVMSTKDWTAQLKNTCAEQLQVRGYLHAENKSCAWGEDKWGQCHYQIL